MIFLAEHFVRAPQWTWYILFYFFFAGLAGGSYAVATLLRLSGDPRDEPAARIGYYVALPATVICPILLSADLGPVSWPRFWHMLIDVTPGDTGLIFKYWSPMSVGAWALLVFGFFVFVSAVEAWLSDRRGSPFAPGSLNRIFSVIGAVVGIFVASYTGVLLSVSNQPVWSDTWMLGGLFLASGLSGSAELMALLMWYRPEAAFSLGRLHQACGYFCALELLLFVAFIVTIWPAGAIPSILPWLPMWVLALVGIAAGLVEARGHMRTMASGAFGAAARIRVDTIVGALLVLVGVFAMRAAVIFSAQ